MSTASMSSIGVILCSSRKPRACPQVAAFVTETIENWISSSSTTTESRDSPPSVRLQPIDLAEWNLPMFDGPEVPSQIKNHADYSHAHARAWSQEIQKHSAFIFVMPQYNWGYPAVIKNAIDYLYNEWHGKPAIIVSYGGHGGGKGAAQLRQVLYGVRMKVVSTMPALAFPSEKEQLKATKGEPLNLLGDGKGMWDSERKNICKAFEELMGRGGGVQGSWLGHTVKRLYIALAS